MTPGARMQAVIELLEQIWSGEEPIDRLTDVYFRKRRYAGSGDRRSIHATLYDVLRHRARLDWWIGRTGSSMEAGPRTRIIAELALEIKSSPPRSRTGRGAVRTPPHPPRHAVAGGLGISGLDGPVLEDAMARTAGG